MAIFNKEPQATVNDRRPTMPAGEGAISVIASGTTLVGDLETNGVIRIEGRIEGAIRSARQVVIGRQGELHGDVHALEAIIGGRVEGTLIISDRLEIQGTGSIIGDIHTKSIVVTEGARINGVVRMEDALASHASEPASPVAIVR